MNIKPIKKVKTTKEIVHDEIKNAIFNGNIKRDLIVTETMLAESFNTSRTPIREAINDLLKDGLLVSIPRKGVKIREVTPSEKTQITFLRLSMEKEGVKKTAQHITLEQVQVLEGIIELQHNAMLKNNRIEFIELDQEFHSKIIYFAELHLFKDILLNLHDLTRLIGHQALAKVGRMEEVIKEHRQILKALQIKDETQSATLMEEHLTKTMESIEIVEGT